MLLETFKETSQQHRKASVALATALQAYDITPKEFEALSVVHNKNQGEIATALSVNLSCVTSLTKELLRHNYITMSDSKQDRRVRYCHVTKKGKDLLERIG